jgi:hypothetical protein
MHQARVNRGFMRVPTAGGVTLDGLLNKYGYVSTPFSERRKTNPKNLKARIEIWQERSLTDESLKRNVRRGKDTDIYTNITIGADRSNLARFNRMQESMLHYGRCLSDFVEEQRPAVRRREKTSTVCARVSKRAGDVTEQFRAYEPIVDRRDRQTAERLLCAG